MTPKRDPDGKVRLTLPDGTVGTALFGDPSHEYRYRPSGTWDAALPRVRDDESKH